MTKVKAESFAHAFIRHGCNASAAYRDAISPNCKPDTARVEGHKYLTKPAVQSILAPLLEALMQKNEVDTEFVLSRLLEQANASPLDYFHITEDGCLGELDLSAVQDHERRTLRSIKVTNNKYGRTITVTVSDQQKAIEMFAKYLDMFRQEDSPEQERRIGDRIEQGVKRIRANRDLQAWKEGSIEGKFSEVG